MNCERCNQRSATVHLTQIINDHKIEMDVCEQCAKEMQQETWGSSPEFNLNNFLSSLLGYGFSPGIKQRSTTECPKCGMNSTRFAKGGLLGCVECYQTFSEQVIPLVRRIHGTTEHTGKVPKRTGGKAKIAKQLRSLKAKLHYAVSREEFEKAAKLRDEIHALEQQL